MIRVCVLIENTADNGFLCEHGLSFWIETNHKKILLDAGSSDAYMENAEGMGIDLNEADYCILSHAHYDHSTGFISYLKQNPNKKLYASKGMKAEYYSYSNDCLHEIGVPSELKQYNNVKYVEHLTQLDQGIFLFPHPKEYSVVAKRARLYRKQDNELVLDDFSHEMSLVLETQAGLVVFNSCCHVGIENLLKEIQEQFNQPVFAFFGGLHLKGRKNNQPICIYSNQEMIELCHKIDGYGLKKLYTGHCTGEIAMQSLEKNLKADLIQLCAGLTIDL